MAKRADSLKAPKPSIWIPIESFAPEPYEVLRPFTAVITPLEEGFEAGFFDANIYASGDTEEEALTNLKSILLDMYDRLAQLDESQLGPGPAKQKQMLTLHIRKRPG